MVFEATVDGYVQGVGYRLFVREAARRLGLAGYVCNLPDGRVYVRAAGEAAKLQDLLSALRRGPSMAQVSDVKFAWLDDAGDLPSGFEVRHS